MNIEPLPASIYKQAKALGVSTITLKFEGGWDEGNCEIEIEPEHDPNLYKEIDTWVWAVYSYSGAGDGSAYGDNIEYNLEKGTVSHSEWYTETVTVPGGSSDGKLEVADPTAEEAEKIAEAEAEAEAAKQKAEEAKKAAEQAEKEAKEKLEKAKAAKALAEEEAKIDENMKKQFDSEQTNDTL